MNKKELEKKISDINYAIAMESDLFIVECLERQLRLFEDELNEYNGNK